MAVSKRLRYEILRRDNHACRYCGAAAPDVKLNVDHVIPQALGGSDAPTNLLTACADCNAGKTSSMPQALTVADVDQNTFRQAAHLKQDAEQRRAAIFVHLYMVWAWAWEKTGHDVTDRDETFFTEETHKLLDCGMSSRTDLTEAAFRAGSHNAVDIASYIGPVMRASPSPLSLEDERFIVGVDTINAWESAWDLASDDGTPTGDVVSRFINEVGIALDAGADPTRLVQAAGLAGQSMSNNLRKHLSELSTAGGDA